MPDFLTTKYGWNGNFHLLTEVKRQEDGSYILKNATNISNAIGKGLTQYNVEAPYYAFQYAVNKYVEDYKNLPADSCISIGCTHNSNQYFNDMVRTRLYGDKPPLIIAGDLMLVTQKWSRNGQELFNGDHVVVEEILLNQIDTIAGLSFAPIKLKSKDLSGKEHIIEDYLLLDSIQFPSGSLSQDRERAIRHERYAKNKVYRESGNPEDDKYIGAIRLAYGHSITCNKAQGGEWDKVYMNCYFIPNLKYSYTAVTRAKNTLIKY